MDNATGRRGNKSSIQHQTGSSSFNNSSLSSSSSMEKIPMKRRSSLGNAFTTSINFEEQMAAAHKERQKGNDGIFISKKGKRELKKSLSGRFLAEGANNNPTMRQPRTRSSSPTSVASSSTSNSSKILQKATLADGTTTYVTVEQERQQNNGTMDRSRHRSKASRRSSLGSYSPASSSSLLSPRDGNIEQSRCGYEEGTNQHSNRKKRAQRRSSLGCFASSFQRSQREEKRMVERREAEDRSNSGRNFKTKVSRRASLGSGTTATSSSHRSHHRGDGHSRPTAGTDLSATAARHTSGTDSSHHAGRRKTARRASLGNMFQGNNSQDTIVTAEARQGQQRTKGRASRRSSMGSSDAVSTAREQHYVGQLDEHTHGMIANELFHWLNQCPWQQDDDCGGGCCYSDEVVLNMIRQFPQICAVKYHFDAFNEDIYPLSMLCSLGSASLAVVEACYRAHPPAIRENYYWAGTPLHCACSYRASSEVVRFLIKTEPAALDAVNRSLRTPLHVCCSFRSHEPDLVALLVRAGGPIVGNADRNGNTPLHLACKHCSVPTTTTETIEILVAAHPAACKVQCANGGATPLHVALEHDAHASALKAIVKGDADALKVADDDGQVPLHVAASVRTDARVFKLLIKNHPKGIKAVNKQGETPLDVARRVGYAGEEVLELLDINTYVLQ